MSQTWLIIGGTRGIGLEFTKQLLAAGHHVTSTYRSSATNLEALRETTNGHLLTTLKCNIADESSIEQFVDALRDSGLKSVDVAVLNAGVLVYPNRISEISFADFATHLHTNTIGPLVTAARLLKLLDIKTLVFISSDSGSAARFMPHEDGFGAYAASKAALNQGIRHLAAEQHRAHGSAAPVVLALHPGEVSTDMANISLPWSVPNVIGAPESVAAMVGVIGEKGKGGSDEGGTVSDREHVDGEASFWTWEGQRYPW